MSAFDHVLDAARSTIRRVVLPEASDSRIVRAAAIARSSGLANPILLGEKDQILRQAAESGVCLDGINILNPSTCTQRATYAQALIEKRGGRLPLAKAERALNDPVTFACMMVSQGDADACVAGAITATADVVRLAQRYVGTRDLNTTVSSCFIMLLKPEHPVDDVMLVGDCAMNISPNAEELASIAVATGDTATTLLGIEPHIAMLSFSTNGSARHAVVTKVKQASVMTREQRAHWRIVGEVQLDAAVIPDILARKAPGQAGKGPCNVLIFPDLNAGNIGYKLIERFGGAKAIGPILQGLAKPVNDLSRGCSTEDVVNIIAVSAAQVVDVESTHHAST